MHVFQLGLPQVLKQNTVEQNKIPNVGKDDDSPEPKQVEIRRVTPHKSHSSVHILGFKVTGWYAFCTL